MGARPDADMQHADIHARQSPGPAAASRTQQNMQVCSAASAAAPRPLKSAFWCSGGWASQSGSGSRRSSGFSSAVPTHQPSLNTICSDSGWVEGEERCVVLGRVGDQTAGVPREPRQRRAGRAAGHLSGCVSEPGTKCGQAACGTGDCPAAPAAPPTTLSGPTGQTSPAGHSTALTAHTQHPPGCPARPRTAPPSGPGAAPRTCCEGTPACLARAGGRGAG